MADPESYQELVSRLARRYDELAAARAAVATWQAEQERAAQTAVDRAASAVARATADVDQARSIVERTDQQEHQIWLHLQDRVGAVGPPPDPSPVAGAGSDPEPWLDAATERLERPPRVRGELPGWVSPLLVVCGVAGTGAGYAVAHAARWAARSAGGDLGVFAPVLEQIVVLAAPFAGLLLAKLLADRAGGRLDGGRIGVVLVAGLLTLGVLVVLLGR